MIVNEYLTPSQGWWVSTLILATAFLVVSATSLYAGYAIREARDRRADRAIWLLPAVLGLWAGGAVGTAAAVELDFYYFLPFSLVPILLGAALSFSRGFAIVLRHVPTHWLVYLQTYRVVGGVFIHPFHTSGVLTAGFAFNAGIGDILTGLAAPMVAWLIARDARRYARVFYLWTAFGILDLIVAPLSAAYFGFGAEGRDPGFVITAIPLFLGPPLGILLHILTWRSFRLRLGHTDAKDSP